jgi:hypothetical protein
MNAGEGRIQAKIAERLAMYDHGRDIIQICHDVYGVRERGIVPRTQRITARRALKRLVELNVVGICDYRSPYGLICWQLKKRHPEAYEQPKRERAPRGFSPKVVNNGE